MYRLPYMVAWESELSLRYGMHEASVMRKHGASALGTHKSVLSKHSKKIVLWIGYIEVVAVCASYYPLCLRRLIPQNTASSICRSRSTCIHGIPVPQVGRHNLTDDRHETEIHVGKLVDNYL